MIEVAHAILEQRGDVMDFSDLANQIQTYLGKSDSEIRDSLAQFYTDLNIDGSFISLGDNRWGLRSWYAIDSIDEEVNHGIDEEDEDTPRRRKRKKVNAFINDDEDAIDYNDDDPIKIDTSDSSFLFDNEDARQFYIRRDILRAISSHTCENIYHIDVATFPMILFVCDELQEWGRKSWKIYEFKGKRS